MTEVRMSTNNGQPSSPVAMSTQSVLSEMTVNLSNTSATDLGVQLQRIAKSLDNRVHSHILPGPFLLPSPSTLGYSESDDAEMVDVEEERQYENEEESEDENEEEREKRNADEGDLQELSEDDLSRFQGDGEVIIGDQLIRVADWLGSEYTERIVRFPNP